MDIYLIRHAESEDNVFEATAGVVTRARFNAWVENNPQTVLTIRGRQQADALAERLRGVCLDALYTSPWPRAHATAEMLGAVLGLAPTPHPSLYEVLPPALPARGNPASLKSLFALSYLRMLLPGARPETWGDSLRRIRGVWHELTQQPAEAIAIVSHGWVITILCILAACSREWRVVSRDLNNCGVSVIKSREGR